ncbi:MAG: HAD family hydrolase [Victivallales bacterium]|jgi:putative hydrolase of the HAD superfamily|nr:HAD family hydrolase [Victivallales bacterium]
MIKGLLFDINGTLTDILTDETNNDIYRVVSNFLDYYGVKIPADEFRRLYFELNKQQRKDNREAFPEFDVEEIFKTIIRRYGSDFTAKLSHEQRKTLPAMAANVFRATSRFKLQLYPGVLEILATLRKSYRLAAVSDGQSLWAYPELHSVGLSGIFDPVIVSSELGYRKPDSRMFELALKELKLAPSEVIFIGNDMYRDVYGASLLKIKTVFFRSNQGEQRKSGAEPNYIIYNFSELPEAIRFLCGNRK